LRPLLNRRHAAGPDPVRGPRFGVAPSGATIEWMKVRDVIRTNEEDGWRHVRTRGSHRQFNRPVKRGVVTVPDKPNDEMAPGTLNSILKQAALK
jgi:predicted RNA binding protein YcfA (HicA-like mRNA interferase family)